MVHQRGIDDEVSRRRPTSIVVEVDMNVLLLRAYVVYVLLRHSLWLWLWLRLLVLLKRWLLRHHNENWLFRIVSRIYLHIASIQVLFRFYLCKFFHRARLGGAYGLEAGKATLAAPQVAHVLIASARIGLLLGKGRIGGDWCLIVVLGRDIGRQSLL